MRRSAHRISSRPRKPTGRRSRLAACAGVVVLLLLSAADAHGAPPPAPPFDKTTRSTIDAAALKVPADSNPPEEFEFVGDVTGWMIANSGMPAEEEARLAGAVHDELLKQMPAAVTPPSAQQVFAQLVTSLPQSPPVGEFTFTLTVLDAPDKEAWTVGGGYVYISKSYLETLLADRKTDHDRLAFVLAHELGHICRKHTRRGYQLLRIQDAIDDEITRHVDRQRFETVLQLGVKVSGKVISFLYNREQEHRADLFALHLCRNVGFDQENALDALRGEVLKAVPDVLERQNFDEPADPPDLTRQRALSDLPADAAATAARQRAPIPFVLRRLKRLRMERDGLVEGSQFGLYRLDRETGRFRPLREKSIPAGDNVLVFIHGIDSTFRIYRKMIEHFADDPQSAGWHILGFHYPNDDSLARSGLFLGNEIGRVCSSPENVNFICHSAGGLVLRYYAEAAGGTVNHAILQGTPNHGSDLAKLRTLLEVRQLARDARLGLPAAFDNVIADGRGQVAIDLEPGSLFLAYLEQLDRQEPRAKYDVFRGRALSSTTAALLLEGSLVGLRTSLERRLARESRHPLVKEAVHTWTSQLHVPREITSGDGAVTLESAALEGVAGIHTYPVHHIALLTNAEVIAEVSKILFSDAQKGEPPVLFPGPGVDDPRDAFAP